MSDELVEMPPEHAFRGPIDPEEHELEATLLAMKNGNNIRHKLQVLGREARDAAKGRTLTSNCWVRLDEYGNPEIIDEKKGYYGHNRFVAARFCVDGIRIACHETAAFARTGGLDRIINYMVDYAINKNGRQPTATLSKIDFEEHGVLAQPHPNLWGWQGHKYDNCPVCVAMKPMLEKMETVIEKANKDRQEVIDSKTIYESERVDDGELVGHKILFVPYSKDVETLAGPEPKIHRSYYGNTTEDMMTVINKHYEKIKTKRGKPKDVF